MITLDTTTRSLEIVLSGAKSTVDCPFVSTYEDVSAAGAVGGSPPSRNSAEQNGVTNGVTAVTIVSAMSAFGGGQTRQIKSVTLFNADNAAITPTIRINDNGTTRVVTTLTLQVGETLQYNDGIGWQCLDTNGNIKTNQPASSGAASTALSVASAGSSVTASVVALTPASVSSQASSVAAIAPASVSSQASSVVALAPASISSQASSIAALNPNSISVNQSGASAQSFTSTNWQTVSSATSRVKSSFSW